MSKGLREVYRREWREAALALCPLWGLALSFWPLFLQAWVKSPAEVEPPALSPPPMVICLGRKIIDSNLNYLWIKLLKELAISSECLEETPEFRGPYGTWGHMDMLRRAFQGLCWEGTWHQPLLMWPLQQEHPLKLQQELVWVEEAWRRRSRAPGSFSRPLCSLPLSRRWDPWKIQSGWAGLGWVRLSSQRGSLPEP